jgi:hypothetical protein
MKLSRHRARQGPGAIGKCTSQHCAPIQASSGAAGGGRGRHRATHGCCDAVVSAMLALLQGVVGYG